MIYTNEYITFLLKTGLTQQQFLLLFLIYKKEQNNIDKYKARFPNADHTMIGREETMYLLETEWLALSKTNILIVTEKFTKHFVSDSQEWCLNELLELYPPFIDKGGVNIPLVTVDKHVYSLKYNRRINYSVHVHQQIVEDLKYGILKGYIKFGISKFIDSEMWVPLRKLRLNEANISDVDLDFDFEEDFE